MYFYIWKNLRGPERPVSCRVPCSCSAATSCHVAHRPLTANKAKQGDLQTRSVRDSNGCKRNRVHLLLSMAPPGGTIWRLLASNEICRLASSHLQRSQQRPSTETNSPPAAPARQRYSPNSPPILAIHLFMCEYLSSNVRCSRSPASYMGCPGFQYRKQFSKICRTSRANSSSSLYALLSIFVLIVMRSIGRFTLSK